MATLPTFRRLITEAAAQRGIVVERWVHAGRASANLLALSTKPRLTVLYTKESNLADQKGFWGLTENQLSRLIKADVKWFAVLLLRSSAAGFLLDAGEIRRLIADGSFELSNAGDYKVHELSDLSSSQRFQSIQELLERVI